MLNIGANQVSALTEADYLQFSRIPELGKVLMLAMQELLILAGYENVELSTKDVLEIMEYLRQYRIIQVCGLRSQVFRQVGQIISAHTDVWVLIFGQADGTICKQGVRRELCGVALTTYPYSKKTSMLQDTQAHRKTEIDYISGDLLKLSRKWNCLCPVNLTMYYLIKSKEKAYLSYSEEGK